MSRHTGTCPPAAFRDHAITGTLEQLANLIANHTPAGRLMAATAPRPMSDGRYRITLRLPDTTSPARRPQTVRFASVPRYPGIRPRPPRRTGRIVALAVTAAGVISGVLAA